MRKMKQDRMRMAEEAPVKKYEEKRTTGEYREVLLAFNSDCRSIIFELCHQTQIHCGSFLSQRVRKMQNHG